MLTIEIDAERHRQALADAIEWMRGRLKPHEPSPRPLTQLVKALGALPFISGIAPLGADPQRRKLVDLGDDRWLMGEGGIEKTVLLKSGGLRDAFCAFSLPTGTDNPGMPLGDGTAASTAAINRRSLAARHVERLGFRGLAVAIRQCRVQDGMLKYVGTHRVDTET